MLILNQTLYTCDADKAAKSTNAASSETGQEYNSNMILGSKTANGKLGKNNSMENIVQKIGHLFWNSGTRSGQIRPAIALG